MKLENKSDISIPECCECLVVFIKDGRTSVVHLAGIRPVQCTENMEQRTFSRPAFAHNGDDFSCSDCQGCSAQHFQCSRPCWVTLKNTFCLKQDLSCRFVRSH